MTRSARHLAAAVAATFCLVVSSFLVVACGGGGGGGGRPSASPTVATPPPPLSETTTFPADTQAELQSALDRVMKKDHIPGVIIGIWAPGKGEWVHAQGLAKVPPGKAEPYPPTPDAPAARPMTLDDRFRIASNTKTFTGETVLILAEQGVFSLDDPIAKYVEGVPNGGKITIRQLLNMTAGVYSFTEDPSFDRRYTRDQMMWMTPQQMIAITRRHGPDFAPGTDWYYSDTNYEILGLLIENVTGRDAADVIMQTVCEPLGLSGTSFPTTPVMPPPFSHGYVRDGAWPGVKTSSGQAWQDRTLSNPAVPWTAGAMVSTLRDVRTWVEALATGKLLTPEMFGEQCKWVEIPGSDGRFLYGLGMSQLDGFRGHTGGIFGYNTIMLHDPVEHATIVIFANSSTNASGETSDILVEVLKIVWPERLPK